MSAFSLKSVLNQTSLKSFTHGKYILSSKTRISFQGEVQTSEILTYSFYMTIYLTLVLLTPCYAFICLELNLNKAILEANSFARQRYYTNSALFFIFKILCFTKHCSNPRWLSINFPCLLYYSWYLINVPYISQDFSAYKKLQGEL